MSRDRLKELLILARTSSEETFGKLCPGNFLLVHFPEDDDFLDLEFNTQIHTGILSAESYKVDQKNMVPAPAKAPSDEEAHPGTALFDIKKNVENGWLEWIAIGRARNNDVIIRHQSVSKLHARVHEEAQDTVSVGLGDELYITDMNSTTGTWINTILLEPSAPKRLSVGDVVRCGQVNCEFLRGEKLYQEILKIS